MKSGIAVLPAITTISQKLLYQRPIKGSEE